MGGIESILKDIGRSGSAQALLRLCLGSDQVRSPLAQVKAAAAHVWRLKGKRQG